MSGRLDFRNFGDVFGNGDTLPYDAHVNRDIESKRKSLGGVLFVDRVFTALGIPKDTRTLHDLFQQILASKMTTHHKLSALYYLLLDHDEGLSARSKIADNFAAQTGMPKRYQIFMSGLWHMDRLQFGVAVEYLAHPSLLPEFADNIVTVLVRHAENNDYALPLAYYAAVQPVLKTQEAVELLFEALARTDVSEAFYYTRTLAGPARQQLFEHLVGSVLKDAAGGGSGGGGGGASSSADGIDAAGRSAELISLPLDSQEEAWLRAYLTAGEGRKLKRAKDTMIMKKIVSGDVDLSEGSKSLSGPWGIVLQGFRHETGGEP
ncbi:hypothetical protein SPBR_06048 [Sporothrix brasiliensis 5110]|uniref:ELYS-like domain-containing protein n=1 Tax=Sporothrix brasiliensis 5110 TaxID=1398154 RepID=A0A0C2F4T8_9PEZI|nr:uncharacterized protein SPBR_06048 [Sporothrix brasiliensis 5110]KIH93939.1 hypothetical protein SPBR_06048 [Sporothrix brasiliensis 5110]